VVQQDEAALALLSSPTERVARTEATAISADVASGSNCRMALVRLPCKSDARGLGGRLPKQGWEKLLPMLPLQRKFFMSLPFHSSSSATK
jgi:hypothetical protein